LLQQHQQRSTSEEDPFGFGLNAIDASSTNNKTDSSVLFERIEIETKEIAEIGGVGNSSSSKTTGTAIVKVLKDVKFYTRKMNSFTRIWNTKKTKARCDASVWAPVTATSWFSRALARPHEFIVLGHYSNEGMKQPRQKIPLLYRTIEVVDSGALGITGSERHWKVINHLLPHPARFQLVWEKRGGKRDLYVWKAIPEDRNRFVSLGHFCTESDEEPPVECMRCVPKAWCVISKEQPRMVWEDSGTAGRKGSLWRVNSMGLVAGTTGHDPPEGPFYDLPLSDDNAWLATSDGGFAAV